MAIAPHFHTPLKPQPPTRSPMHSLLHQHGHESMMLHPRVPEVKSHGYLSNILQYPILGCTQRARMKRTRKGFPRGRKGYYSHRTELPWSVVQLLHREMLSFSPESNILLYPKREAFQPPFRLVRSSYFYLYPMLGQVDSRAFRVILGMSLLSHFRPDSRLLVRSQDNLDPSWQRNS